MHPTNPTVGSLKEDDSDFTILFIFVLPFNHKPFTAVPSLIDLRVFQAMPGNSIVLLPDTPVFTIVAATNSYHKTSGRSEEELIGKGIFEAFPSPPDDPGQIGVKQLRTSLESVIDQKTLDRMPLVRYDIENADGAFNERYWSSVNKPVLNENGELLYIIHTAEEMTQQVKAEHSANKIKSLENSYDLFMQAPVTIGVVKGSEYIIELANDNLLEVWGRTSEVIGKSLFEAIPELKDQGFRTLLDQVYKTGEPYYAYEHPIQLIRRGKEEVFYFDFVYKPFFEEGKTHPVGVLAVGHDVTKQVESRHKFKTVIEEAKDPILILIGEDLVLDTANQALFDLWQVSPAAVGKSFLEILPEMKGQGFYELLQNVLHTGAPFFGKEVPVVFQRKNGTEEILYFDFSYQPYRNAEGSIMGVLVIARDVSGQVLARKRLEESESRFRLMADTVPAIIWITEKDGSCSYLNKRWYNSTGQSETESLGFGWLQAVHPDDSDRSGKIFLDANAAGEAFHLLYRLRQKDGNYRWAIDSGEPRFDADGKFAGYIGSVIDVHEQVMAEENMRRSEERYRHLFQNSPVSKWDEDFTTVKKKVDEMVKSGIADFESYFAEHPGELLALIDSIVINDVNEAALRMWGGSKQELLSGLQQFFIEDTLDAFIKEVCIIAAGGGRFETETTVQSNAGQKINVLVRIDFPKGEDYSSVPVILVNITERKRAEEALRESESRFRTLAEALPQMVWMRNNDGIIEYGSKHWEEYSGIRGVSEAWKAMVHPDDWKRIMDAWNQDSTKGQPYRYEVRLKNKDGNYRWHYASGEPIKGNEGNVMKWIGALTDIHAQKTFSEKLEKEVAERTGELQTSEKKLALAVKELERSNEDLQQFAHVASHDLKEPVRKVKMFINRLEHHLEGKLDETGTKFIERVHSATNRMFTMIDGVLQYSTISSEIESHKPVDLNEVIKNIETDLEVIIQKTSAEIQISQLPTIEGAPVLLYQVFYNLINNSIKFTRAGISPQIIISADIVVENDRQFVKLVFSDNGIGFEESQAKAIFDTFTRLHSKDKYEGTGLGLALCKKVVERHGGRIWAHGIPGEGATFKILLPLLQSKGNI